MNARSLFTNNLNMIQSPRRLFRFYRLSANYSHSSPSVIGPENDAATISAATQSTSVVSKTKKKKKKSKEPVTYVGPRDGARKDTTLPLPDVYNPQYVEAAWPDWWEAMGFFSTSAAVSQQQQQQQFSIVLPPPNVTGKLHIGHALTVAVQDALCRWRRMSGDRVTWIPGFDHAGIATQSVVERKLMTEEGKTREDIGRDAFRDRVMGWKNEKGSSLV